MDDEDLVQLEYYAGRALDDAYDLVYNARNPNFRKVRPTDHEAAVEKMLSSIAYSLREIALRARRAAGDTR